MKVGIFDSGMGGLSVLATAKKILPYTDFIYYGDSGFAPYGTKSKLEVIERSIVICDFLMDKGVEAIVVACNTATSAAINFLREKYPIPIIGMEPAIKPAIEKNEGKDIAVMATPMTLREDKFNALISKFEMEQNLYTIPAPKLVEIVESGEFDDTRIEEALKEYFEPVRMNNLESVVLGCTHFLFVKNHIQKFVGNQVKMVDGNLGTVQQLARKLADKELFSDPNHQQEIEFYNSSDESKIELSIKLLNKYEETYGNQ